MVILQFRGYLKELVPNPLKLAASTAYAAISLLRFHPEFATTRRAITIEGFNCLDNLYQELPEGSVLVIDPLIQGAGGGSSSTKMMVIGAVMVGLSMVLAPYAAGNLLATKLVTGVGYMGYSVLLGGALQRLMPTPKTEANHSSQFLSGDKNTTKIGTRIPLLYGKGRIYGQILSFQLSTVDIKYVGNTVVTLP